MLVQAQVFDVQSRWVLFHRGLEFLQRQSSPTNPLQGPEVLIATHLPKEDSVRL